MDGKYGHPIIKPETVTNMYKIYLLLIMLCSCTQMVDHNESNNNTNKDTGLKPVIKYDDTPLGITIISVDNCQYIYAETRNGVAIVHKENCSNQLH